MAPASHPRRARPWSGLLALTWILAAGCQPEIVPFQIHLDFASPPNSPAPCPGPCGDIPLSCSSLVSIRVVDAKDPTRLLDEKCSSLPVSESTTMCALGNIDVPLKDMPVGRARIEIAMWDAAALAAPPHGGRCPGQPIFDLQGYPLPTVDPQPAVAGTVYFDLGSAPRVTVPLSCPAWQQVNRPTCQPPSLAVELIDLERGRKLNQDDVPLDLEVHYALPSRGSGGGWFLSESEMSMGPLQRQERGQVASWQGRPPVPLAATDPLCVLVRHGAEGIPVVSCVPRGDTTGELKLDALYLSQTVADEILQAAGLVSVPSDGVVIGRVVAATPDIPVAGAVVEPTHAPSEIGSSDIPVEYLSEDRSTTVEQRATASHGYFLSASVPFPSAWLAYGADGATGDASPYLGGYIQDVVNAIRIELRAP